MRWHRRARRQSGRDQVPSVGGVIAYGSTYAETRSAATGQIHDGDAARVTEIGGPVVGDITFHWPTLDFDYPVTNGHASITNQFSTPDHGVATLTETYDDGCVVMMQDNS